MFLSDLSIKRPIMMSMILVALLLFGFIGYRDLPLTLMPDFNLPVVTVQTTYAGASPLETESQITKKIEDEVAAISLVDQIISYSMENVSIVMVQFDLGKDEDVALQEVKDKVDQILNKLPDGANRPIIQKVDISEMPIINIVMEGDLSATEIYDLAENKVKDRLAQVKGVGKVDIVGGEEREIRVELDKRVIYENSISLSQLAGIIAMANQDMPGGNLKEAGQEYAVRLEGKIPTVETLRNLNIPTATGNKKLWQLADVKDSIKEVRQRVTFINNQAKKRTDNSVLLTVVKTPLGNTVETVDAITKILPEIEQELGNGITLTVVSEQGTFVKDVADDAFGNIYQGIILTALILLLFLHDLRSTLIIAISMPLSIIPTFMVMKLLGISLNVLSLMGLSTASGILVANSVVVLESIFRRRNLGDDRKQAAALGTAEVTTAVIASTLTNIIVFLPIGTMPGLAGLILRDLALTITAATLFSILASFTVTPMLAGLILPEESGAKNRFGIAFDRFFKSWEDGYRKLLEFILSSKTRCRLVIVVTVLLFIGTIFIFTKIPFDFMPSQDAGNLKIVVELPLGYELNETAKMLQRIEERVAKHQEVVSLLTTLGKESDLNQGVNLASISVKLVGKDERKLSDKELAALLTKELSNIPGAKIKVSAISGFTTSGSTSPVSFYLRGQDINRLEEYADLLSAKLKKIQGLMNIDTSTRPGKPEITILPDRVKMSDAGITIQELAVLIRASLEGIEVTEYKEGGNEYDIRVVLNKESIPSYEELNNLPVYTKIGTFPIAHFAELKFTSGYNKVMHTDKYTAIQFTADLLPGYALGDMTKAIDQAVKELNLPSGYHLKWGGFADLMYETLGNMAFALVLAIVLCFMLLAATVENFSQPIIIMLTVPLCLIGVAFSLVITGMTLSVVAMFSVIMLVGMVVNSAILILDYTNQLRAEGMDLREALLEACPVKLKAIIMSNLAAILGVLPMAMGIGASGAELRQPLGVATIGGLISATILTLMVIPVVENLIGQKRSAGKKHGVAAKVEQAW
ncbi:MAG: efflux RND transporter permease subunit [Firmicutes bacterium]|nr:efflux RND transporter permease subunit [Bacillota bacterium]